MVNIKWGERCEMKQGWAKLDTALLISIPFDIFNENVLQPSHKKKKNTKKKKKRAQFSLLLYTILIRFPIYTIVQSNSHTNIKKKYI